MSFGEKDHKFFKQQWKSYEYIEIIFVAISQPMEVINIRNIKGGTPFAKEKNKPNIFPFLYSKIKLPGSSGFPISRGYLELMDVRLKKRRVKAAYLHQCDGYKLLLVMNVFTC